MSVKQPRVQDWQPDWFPKAACLESDPKIFFPVNGHMAAKAIKVCQTCPVIEECREFGSGEEYGVWGGLTATAITASRT